MHTTPPAMLPGKSHYYHVATDRDGNALYEQRFRGRLSDYMIRMHDGTVKNGMNYDGPRIKPKRAPAGRWCWNKE